MAVKKRNAALAVLKLLRVRSGKCFRLQAPSLENPLVIRGATNRLVISRDTVSAGYISWIGSASPAPAIQLVFTGCLHDAREPARPVLASLVGLELHGIARAS